MKVAVLGEKRPGESRVALVPTLVKELINKNGFEVRVEAGAGVSSHFLDNEYEDVGATIAQGAAALDGADVVLKVAPPTLEEIQNLPRETVLVSFLAPFDNPDLVTAMAERGITSFSMELVPRTTRAQRMDALSSQATVAGYKAVLMGASELGKLLPMFMTAAGTIRPGKVMVLGAGVAGLQAIATARRLGAKVEAFDVRPAVKEQVESLGATFLETEHDVSAEGEGGYAKELSEEQHQRELELIAKHIADTDIVITTAQIPGRPAPVLITEAMIKSMRPGSVVVDLAAPSGGNCEMTRVDETVISHGVHVMGPSNVPGTIPVHASQMYARNIATLVLEMVTEEGMLDLDFENDVLGPCCVTHGGNVVHGPTRERMGLGEAKPIRELAPDATSDAPADDSSPSGDA